MATKKLLLCRKGSEGERLHVCEWERNKSPVCRSKRYLEGWNRSREATKLGVTAGGPS